MTTEFAATLAINCARPDGLVDPLRCASRQVFNEPWELLIVNWVHGEQDELVRALWKEFRERAELAPIPLHHVAPLPPMPPKTSYGSWDMGTTFNTGWTYARGEIYVSIDDFWVFDGDWLRKHVEAARAHSASYNAGHNLTQPFFDPTAPFHYGVDAIVMLNFSHYTRMAWGNGGFGAPEYPTRHPESTIIPRVFPGVEVRHQQDLFAWHVPHYPDGAPAQVLRKNPYTSGDSYTLPDGSIFDGIWPYIPVEHMHNGVAYTSPNLPEAPRRNLIEARKAIGNWV